MCDPNATVGGIDDNPDVYHGLKIETGHVYTFPLDIEPGDFKLVVKIRFDIAIEPGEYRFKLTVRPI
jgi:hypothetical protein